MTSVPSTTHSLLHRSLAHGRQRGLAVAIASIVGILVFAACANPSAPSTVGSPSRPSATVTTSTSGSPSSSPVATESNPPGDIPDNQIFVAYTATGFSLRVPEGWARSTVVGGVSYTDKLNSVTITAGTAATAPTPASARTVDVPALARAVPKLSLRSITTVARPAGTAVLVMYQCDSPTDPVTGKVVRDAVERYLFWHGGHTVTLTLSGPLGADNVDPWKTVTTSLRWTA